MTSTDLTKWSRQQWCRVIGGILGIQLLVIAGFSSRQALIPRAVVRDTNWRTPAETKDLSKRKESLSSDPWLFASANPSGFSGSAWFHPASTDYQVPAWEDPSDFLDLSETIPLNPLAHFSGLASLPRNLNLELAPQFLAPKGSSNQPVSKPSRWSLSGDIATNTLLSNIQIPHQMGIDIVSNTVVQIAVLPTGLTHVARVWGSSGSHPMDLQAVAIAQNLRFVPMTPVKEVVESPNLTWGWFEVQWHTEAQSLSKQAQPSSP